MKESMRNKTVLVIGGGKYGLQACRHLKEQMARVILVDNNPDCLAHKIVSREDFIVKDAKEAWELALSIKPEFTVPTHPGHTFGIWLAECFQLEAHPDPLPKVMGRLPHSLILHFDETNAAVIASYMPHGKTCREDCPPFKRKCTLTNEPRPAPLNRLMEYAIFELFDCARIFATETIAPGIGGIRTADIMTFMQEIDSRAPRTLAVGIACECHGALSLFKTKIRTE